MAEHNDSTKGLNDRPMNPKASGGNPTKVTGDTKPNKSTPARNAVGTSLNAKESK